MPKASQQHPDESSKSDHPSGETAGARSMLELSSKSILHTLPIAIVAFDRDLKIVEANPEAANLLDLAERVDESLANGTDEQIWQGWTEQLNRALSTGETCEFDEVSYTSKGRTRLLRIACTPVARPGTKEILGGTVVVEDVTERMNVQRQLADAERLAAVGKLASKVAHELNNPMDGILRYVNLAMRIVEAEKLEKPKEYLEQCRQGLMRMVRIVSELLEFSRRTTATLEYARIDQIVDDTLKTMESRAQTLGVRIERDYASGMPQMRSGNLFQVFCNLAKNALDAMADGGELRISTRLEGGDTAVAEFGDTGGGFAPEDAETLFEPFFTTKERDKGTGLGLAICRDIVESRHGRITAQNAPGGGSVFTVFLPVPKKHESNP